jgi:ribosomal protein L11 methyltransferase
MMNKFIKISFNAIAPADREIIIASLNELNFNGFEEGHQTLEAYCNLDEFDEKLVVEFLEQGNYKYEVETIEDQNWNQIWEENFQPVSVDQFCTIRAAFHPPVEGTVYDIIITPKMSFGTGHHATTYMMIEQMQALNLKGMEVLDFGTGTGVLAILAEKMGAASVLGIDNDDWSIENAHENILFNQCRHILIQKADNLSLNQNFDLILANINKNVLMATMSQMKQHLKKEGVLVLSGLLEGDRPAIENRANENGLFVEKSLSREGWISLKLVSA